MERLVVDSPKPLFNFRAFKHNDQRAAVRTGRRCVCAKHIRQQGLISSIVSLSPPFTAFCRPFAESRLSASAPLKARAILRAIYHIQKSAFCLRDTEHIRYGANLICVVAERFNVKPGGTDIFSIRLNFLLRPAALRAPLARPSAPENPFPRRFPASFFRKESVHARHADRSRSVVSDF